MEDDIHTCHTCNKNIGYCCGVLYHEQSKECYCKDCFDFKCYGCKKKILTKSFYCDGVDGDAFPRCNDCKEKNIFIYDSDNDKN